MLKRRDKTKIPKELALQVKGLRAGKLTVL